MGTGTLRGGRFNLLLSVRHDASAARLDQWHESWQRASELLFDATDGQHQLGDIYVVNDSHGGRNADAWLMENDGRSSAGGLGALGTETTHMTIWGDERFKPFVLLHELIHYLYGPADEYSGPDGGAECVGGSTSDACIMEGGWWEGDRFGDDATGGDLVTGRFSELCTDENHDPDTDTWQDDRWSEDCWQTVVDTFPALTKPTGAPTAAAPTGAGTIDWIQLVPEERFVLVVDRSGSMSGPKIQEAKFGADWWADQALDGEHLGVVSYATSASSPPDYSLAEVTGDADRAAAQSAVAGITAGGRTAIGEGLRTGLDEILAAGDRASTQVIVLLTDGLHNEGEAPGDVLPDLIDNGVRVYTIGVGPSIDATLLQQLADDTGGTFTRIDPSLPISDQEFAIRTALQQISGVSRDGGGVITTFPERVETSGGEGAGEREAKPVKVEQGSELATFMATWPSAKHYLQLRLTSPNGRVIEAGAGDPDVRELGGDRPWHGFHIREPEPGTWYLEVLPVRVQEAADAEVFAFSRNRSIEASLDVRRVNLPGDRVPIAIRAYHDVPLSDLRLSGEVITPSGDRVPVQFGDAVEDANRCDVGTIPAVFEQTKQRGVYRLKVVTDAVEGETRPARGGEKLRDPDAEQKPEVEVPSFQRTYTASFRVGEEPRRSIAIDPDRAEPGEQLSVRIDGHLTRFESRGTFASFGPDVRIRSQEVLDASTMLVDIVVDQRARQGRHTVNVTTPRWNETVVLEEGFQIGRDRPAPDFFGRLGCLVYDSRSRLVGVKLSSGDRVEAPSSAERVLREAWRQGDAVRLSVGDDGLIDRIELC